MTRDEARRRDAERSSRDYWARKTSGRCIERGCPNPASDTATRCEEHRQRFNARQERRRFVCALLGLVVAACGGVVESPGPRMRVRVAVPDAGVDAATFDAALDVVDGACVETDHLLCQHPKGER